MCRRPVPGGLWALLLLAATPLGGSELARVLEPGSPPDARRSSAVTLDGYHPWTPPRDLEEWNARRERVRRQVLVAAGLWPMPPKTPLEPVIHGRIDRDDYTVEKVYFQSLPGFYVTGNLYRPKGAPARRPAVLSPHGHWANGRFYERGEGEAQAQIEAGKERWMPGARYPLQARCVQLARMGCVVFHYDMVGYADSRQIGHTQGFGDVEAELRLQSAFGLQTWNTIRAFDFLAGLAEVDPERIGVTGASGGGTQTFILCAIDERPAAAFPAVMVSTSMQGGCVCENASHLRVGTGNIELAALAAPRPYGMTGAGDWTREILTKGLPELKALYEAYGKEDLVDAWCYPEFEHNYNQVSREHMYEWFNRHLGLGRESPARERPFEPIPPAELSVFDEAHPPSEDAVDAAGVRAWFSETSKRQLEGLVPRDAGGLAAFRDIIGGALEVLLHTRAPGPGEVEVEKRGEPLDLAGYELRKLLIRRKGSGEAVPAILLRPQDWKGRVLVTVLESGKGACFSPADLPSRIRFSIREVLDRGTAVLAPDVFLVGESLGEAENALEVLPKDGGRHGRYAGYTYGYNRTLLAERVHDVLTAVRAANDLDGATSVRLAGYEAAGAWVLLARALAGDSVEKTLVVAADPFSALDVDALEHPEFLPGARKYGGMPVFAGLAAPGELWLVHLHPPPDALRAAYRAAGKPGALHHVAFFRGDSPQERELFEWIAR